MSSTSAKSAGHLAAVLQELLGGRCLKHPRSGVPGSLRLGTLGGQPRTICSVVPSQLLEKISDWSQSPPPAIAYLLSCTPTLGRIHDGNQSHTVA